ncbi:hypothetical protein AAFF_G00341070 [Aldrovandia affinis]|uniref:Uncharacterized protein n=1 Tax=Aldrovandia affinis TaxID=143900 RepID=A0AAD7SKN0_9TELE|nr:hypothetical protein AAFF_G00341070 [Aldrovandia affinis]
MGHGPFAAKRTEDFRDLSSQLQTAEDAPAQCCIRTLPAFISLWGNPVPLGGKCCAQLGERASAAVTMARAPIHSIPEVPCRVRSESNRTPTSMRRKRPTEAGRA